MRKAGPGRRILPATEQLFGTGGIEAPENGDHANAGTNIARSTACRLLA